MALPLIEPQTLDDYASQALFPHFMGEQQAGDKTILTFVSRNGCWLESRPMGSREQWVSELTVPVGGVHRHAVATDYFRSRQWRVDE